MSENDKERKVKFITEQIVKKKYSKIKKIIMALLATSAMGVLFGVIAAATFIVAEPRLYERFGGKNKPQIKFEDDEYEDTDMLEGNDDIDGTLHGHDSIKDDENNDKDKDDVDNGNEDKDNEKDIIDIVQEPTPVIIESSIDADVEDFVKMYADIKKIALESGKSILKILSTINSTDMFNNPIEKVITTTGLIVADTEDELYVLVNLDRVKDASTIQVELTENLLIEATLLDYEKDVNLAVLVIKTINMPEIFKNVIQTAKLGESYSITVGSPIIALGNPNGYANSMEVGFISSKGSVAEITDNQLNLFNTNLKDNKDGDGVIVNTKGEIIGIITHTLKENLNKELNTAIGISSIKPIIERMVNQTPKVYFGIKSSDMREQVLIGYNISNGIYINEVESKSPAFISGMKCGDIILQINNQAVTSTSSFNKMISDLNIGNEIRLKIKRTSLATEKDLEIKARLTEKPR